MRARLGRDAQPATPRGVHFGEALGAADVHHVGPGLRPRSAHARDQPPDRLDLRRGRASAAPGQPVGAFRGHQLGAEPLHHRVTLRVHPDHHTQPRGRLEARREHAVGYPAEVVYAAFTHERFEADHSARRERRQLREIVIHQTAPQAEVHQSLRGGDREFGVEIGGGDGRRMSVEGHLEHRGDAPRRGAAGAGVPALPVGAARLVEMHVGVYHTWQDHEPGCIDELVFVTHLGANCRDHAIPHPDVHRRLARR
ncbi:MAG TPA: hypothetical protein VEK86_00705 [Gemmatimonadales bacterium]|nr:hypothetical protein [Gemmatimonadales bacterium]